MIVPTVSPRVCGLALALSGAQHKPRSGNLLLRVRDEQLVSRRACHIRHASRPKTNVRHLARGGQVRDSRGQLERYEIEHLQQS